MLLHHYRNHKAMVTGHVANDIEKDVPSINSAFSENQILEHILKDKHLSKSDIRLSKVKKIIYIDPKTYFFECAKRLNLIF